MLYSVNKRYRISVCLFNYLNLIYQPNTLQKTTNTGKLNDALLKRKFVRSFLKTGQWLSHDLYL